MLKKYGPLVLKLGISVGLMAWLLSGFEVSFWGYFSNTDTVPYFLAAVVLCLLHIESLSWRYHVLLESADIRLPYAKNRAATSAGFFLGQVLPSTVGGDVYRGWLLYRSEVSPSQASALLVVDRVYGLLSLLLLIALALPFGLAGLLAERGLVVSSLFLYGGLGFVMVLAALWWASQRSQRIQQKLRPILAFFRGMAQLFTNGRAVARVLGISLVSTLLLVAAFAVLLQAQVSHAVGVGLFLALPVILLLQALPVAFGGWGMRESAAAFLLAPVGLTEATSIEASIAFGLSLMLAASLMALPTLFQKRDVLGKVG